jgi:hypothetical protein
MKSVMELDSQTNMSSAPLEQAARFLTHPSSVVRFHARQSHIDALRHVRAPWYKTLQLANLDDDDDDDDEYERRNQSALDDVARNDILNNPNRYEYEKRKFHSFEANRSARSIRHGQ